MLEIPFVELQRPIEARYGQIVDENDDVLGLFKVDVPEGELGFLLKKLGGEKCLVAFSLDSSQEMGEHEFVVLLIVPSSWLGLPSY
jgi:hypothetical protein